MKVWVLVMLMVTTNGTQETVVAKFTHNNAWSSGYTDCLQARDKFAFPKGTMGTVFCRVEVTK
jgi:hypothetical protein